MGNVDVKDWEPPKVETVGETEGRSVTEDANTGRPVIVHWMDSGYAIPNWVHAHELPTDVAQVQTVGLWIGSNDHVIAIAGSSAEGGYLNVQLIWRPSIIGKEWLDREGD